ncbi:hypothetical protein ACF0H5_008526 [Mactra antiquata]
MKFTTVLVLVLVVCVVALEAKKNKQNKKIARKERKSKCMKQVTFSDCIDNEISRTIKQVPKVPEDAALCKKEGKPRSYPCVSNNTFSKQDCELEMQFDLSTCANFNGTIPMNKTVTIVGRSGTSCKSETEQPTEVVSSCGSIGGPGPKKLGKKVKTRGDKVKRCKYRRDAWSECDPKTNKKTMTRPLKSGNAKICKPVQIIERPCKNVKKRRKKTASVCKYRRGEWSDCDGATNIKTMIKTLKRGNPRDCQPTQTIEKICKRQHKGLRSKCIYRKTEKWGPCDPATGFKSREMMLKKGDASLCAPKKTMTKQCKKKMKDKSSKKKGCKYEKSQWGPCDASTNTVRRTLNLKDGDPIKCNATKLQVKKCKNKHLRPHVCKYKRTTWEECDSVTNMRVMIKTLKRGDPSKCEPTQTIERKCKGKKQVNVCKYKYEQWSACNVTTNTMTRRQVLKSGPESCQAVKEYSKKCKKPCKWQNGVWSECDAETNQMTRIDTLRKAAGESCPQTRVLTKKCGKAKKCTYDHGTWSECDTTESPVRTRTQKLVTGDPGCQPEKITTKSCTKQNGDVRCFFGPWQEYDDCKNGVQKKRRQVIQGGLDCERKSVKMKPC